MRISDWSSDVCSSDLQRGRSMTRRIGILTSGGDCAGLNAVIRAVAIHATRNFGWTVVGIEKGTAGLMARPVQAQDLDPDMFDGTFLRRGGTILRTEIGRAQG